MERKVNEKLLKEILKEWIELYDEKPIEVDINGNTGKQLRFIVAEISPSVGIWFLEMLTRHNREGIMVIQTDDGQELVFQRWLRKGFRGEGQTRKGG